MGVAWDQPDADPMADVLEFIRLAQAVPPTFTGSPLIVGAAAYDQIKEILGRELTVEDIPPGAPGNWTSIRREPPYDQR